MYQKCSNNLFFRIMQPHQVFIYFCGCSVLVLVDSMLRIPIISTDKGLSSGGFICPVQSTLNLLLLINIFNPCRKMRGLNPEIKIIIISTYLTFHAASPNHSHCFYLHISGQICFVAICHSSADNNYQGTGGYHRRIIPKLNHNTWQHYNI